MHRKVRTASTAVLRSQARRESPHLAGREDTPTNPDTPNRSRLNAAAAESRRADIRPPPYSEARAYVFAAVSKSRRTCLPPF